MFPIGVLQAVIMTGQNKKGNKEITTNDLKFKPTIVIFSDKSKSVLRLKERSMMNYTHISSKVFFLTTLFMYTYTAGGKVSSF